jgi:hypothetical protein
MIAEQLMQVQPLISTKWPNTIGLNPFQIHAVTGWHCADEVGLWDIETLVRDLRTQLVHSHWCGRAAAPDTPRNWYTIVFALEQNLFVAIGQQLPGYSLLRVWAHSPERAEAEFVRLRKAYFRQPSARTDTDKAEFFVLTFRLGEPMARAVTISPKIRTAADLVLNYGKDFEEWHRQLVAQLKVQQSGVTILRGSPGTGKSTYLRHLLYELKETHRFYCLPLSVYPMLSSPACVDFWLGETDQNKNVSKVVVIEDAEGLLVERGIDNQESLSNLLNIADGFLGDFLKLHVICTVNAAVSKLDPAIVRPGRLIATREFRRLTPAEAEMLAQTRGLSLQPQDSYSLAEIYNSFRFGDGSISEERHVGFAA